MATWPVAIPQRLAQSGFRETPPDLGISFQSESGLSLSRQRFTAGARRFNCSMNLTGTELAVLDTFYNDTVAGTSLPFDWVHPRTQVAAEFKFTSEITYETLGGDEWLASWQMVLIP